MGGPSVSYVVGGERVVDLHVLSGDLDESVVALLDGDAQVGLVDVDDGPGVRAGSSDVEGE